jgi:hypothetical protein
VKVYVLVETLDQILKGVFTRRENLDQAVAKEMKKEVEELGELPEKCRAFMNETGDTIKYFLCLENEEWPTIEYTALISETDDTISVELDTL